MPNSLKEFLDFRVLNLKNMKKMKTRSVLGNPSISANNINIDVCSPVQVENDGGPDNRQEVTAVDDITHDVTSIVEEIGPSKAVVVNLDNAGNLNKPGIANEEMVMDVEEPESYNFKCDRCNHEVNSWNGLKFHYQKKHSSEPPETYKVCKFCNKSVKYLDVHLRVVHPNLVKTYCKICSKEKTGTHRCVRCPYPHCTYQNTNPKRLFKHIVKCRLKDVVEDQPLDLSPLKRRADALSSYSDRGRSDVANEVDPEDQRRSKRNERNDSLTEWRSLHPFDKVSDTNVSDEGYLSEYEAEDTVEKTQERRNIKDSLELELRRRDELDLCNEKDDVPFLNKFEEFMVTITGGRDVGTVGEYTNLVKSYLIPTFHESYSPFSALWLIDCETKKQFTINGNNLVNVLPEEPVYLTSQVFEAVMNKAQSPNTKKKLLAAVKKIQEFQELEISKTTGTMGLEPLQKVQSYRRRLDVYITDTAQWRKVWYFVRKNQEDNKKNQGI